jgi:hypothetical protein
MVSTLPTPRACGWRSLSRKCEPTSDVLCRRRGTFSSAPPTRSLATADRLATTRVLHRSDQKRAPPARLRAISHHSRTPSAVSRTMSCDSVETRMRIRPRESSLSRPFASASFVPPHRRVDASYSVARSSLERRSRTACDRTSRRTQQVIDQRCVRPAFCQRHFDYGHPRFVRRSAGAFLSCGTLASPGARSCRCMARFTTPHALRMCRSFTLFEAGVSSSRDVDRAFHPLTLPSPHTACPPDCARTFDGACARLSPTGGDPLSPK